MADPHAIIVVGLGYGDCGKGSIVDYLVRRHEAHAVVRFNGGPQAAHNVITPDGRHHTFAQFGSGTFIPGVRTILSRFMLIEPYSLFNEAEHLRHVGAGDALDQLIIDGRCAVITPCHQAANRLRELARGAAAHGTCGMGVGEAMADLAEHPEMMLCADELASRAAVRKKLHAFRDLKLAQLRDILPVVSADPRAAFNLDVLHRPTWIDTAAEVYAQLARQAEIVDETTMQGMLRSPGTMIFEGAQGVLLDESFGFHPHTTWSTTTFANADALLAECAFPGRRTRLGVLRTYLTRHGPGPFVTEDPSLNLPEPHNDGHGWQGRFRTGIFDAVATRYALAACGGVDGLALTHMDRVSRLPPRICTAYSGESSDDDGFIHCDGRITDIRVRRPADLAHQQRVTNALRSCRPEWLSVANEPAAMRAAIERELQVPIIIISAGPRAEAKSR